MTSLAGKVALVTGASRGIGRAVALALGEAGADLVVTSTREGGTGEIRRQLGRTGRRAVEVPFRAEQPGDAERLADAALAAFSGVDLLVNNAGVVHRALLAKTSGEDFERVLAVNLTAPFLLIRRLVPPMVERGWGRVVNISSISGTVGTASLAAYCASKWGLNGLTKALAEELAGTGVLVAAVLPGSVDTDMLEGSGFEPRVTPQEVAAVVRYLCAGAPLTMNGSLVEVFG
ncbi:MAG: SDR family oxidoreductase [Myxococcales bacterium]|nr:SDR family oxidoreductase [Myxococcales bacterium]